MAYSLNTQPNGQLAGNGGGGGAQGWYGPTANSNGGPSTAGVGGPMFGMFPQNDPTFRQNQLNSASLGGQVAGTYANSVLNSVPSLAGLMGGGSAGSIGSGSGSSPITLQPIQGLDGGSGGGIGASYSTAGGSGGGGGYVPQVQMPDMTAANAAQYNAAKDTVGQNARAALDSLRGELGATGGLGGGAESTGVQNVITQGEGELGNVARQQAATNANTALQVAEENANLGTTQRGQDISATTAQRGQTLGAEEAQMNAQIQQQEAQARLALENRQQLFSVLGLALGGLKGGSTGSTSSGSSLY